VIVGFESRVSTCGGWSADRIARDENIKSFSLEILSRFEENIVKDMVYTGMGLGKADLVIWEKVVGGELG
jgi:hypothetical protein